jgi:NADPH:quinone reductase-like Zn-dependent oxidoreductase
MCGTVVATGDSQPGCWHVGDRVLSIFNQTHLTGQIKERDMAFGLGLPLDGVLQTYRVFPVTGLVKAPDYLTDEEACTLPIAGVTAWMSLSGLKPLDQTPGDRQTVLLQGTGGVSIAGLQIAHAAGATSELNFCFSFADLSPVAVSSSFQPNHRLSDHHVFF